MRTAAGVLVAVAVLDVLPRCLSSKYAFWEPDLAHLSLGKLTALREIAWVQAAARACPALHYYYQARLHAGTVAGMQRAPRRRPLVVERLPHLPSAAPLLLVVLFREHAEPVRWLLSIAERTCLALHSCPQGVARCSCCTADCPVWLASRAQHPFVTSAPASLPR